MGVNERAAQFLHMFKALPSDKREQTINNIKYIRTKCNVLSSIRQENFFSCQMAQDKVHHDNTVTFL